MLYVEDDSEESCVLAAGDAEGLVEKNVPIDYVNVKSDCYKGNHIIRATSLLKSQLSSAFLISSRLPPKSYI